MGNDFKKVMEKHSDEKLIEIVTIKREDYQPSAIEAAEEEIKTRSIDLTKTEQIKTELVTEIEEQELLKKKQVGSGLRFVHFLIDTIVIVVTIAIFGFITSIIMDFFFYSGFWVSEKLMYNFITILNYLITSIAFFGYYIFTEYKFQKTVGKMITKTKVVTINNEKPSMKTIIGRTFARFIPLDNISFLVSKNGFHDRLSDTIVIKDK